VLYALGSPLSLVLLVASYLVAVTLSGWVQATVAARHGDRQPAAEGRTRPDPRRHVDPFGAIAALIAGIGWARPVQPPDRRRRSALLAVTLSGPLANLALGLASLAVFRVLGGAFFGAGTVALQQGVGGDLLLRAALLLGLSNLFVGALQLMPLPPLPGGRLLFGLAPQTPGWRKAELHLVERNLGTAVVLALLLIPLGGPQALLPALLDTVAGPLVRALAGG
jgi:Zn-dependent protease